MPNCRDTRFLPGFGVARCVLEAIRVREPSVPTAFSEQKKAATQRGIAWGFNLATWWDIWERSGHWKKRGRGGYVMGRIGDVGPYSPGNVYICTQQQNAADSYISKPYRTRNHKEPRGYTYAPAQRTGLPFQVRIRRKVIGYFATAAEARAAYLKTQE